MRDEKLCRQFRSAPITPRQIFTAGEKLSHYSDGRQTQFSIEYIDLNVIDRTTDRWYRVRIVFVDESPGSDHGVFRRSVVVCQSKRQTFARCAPQPVAARH